MQSCYLQFTIQDVTLRLSWEYIFLTQLHSDDDDTKHTEPNITAKHKHRKKNIAKKRAQSHGNAVY